MRRRLTSEGVVLVVGWALLLAAWTLGNVPFAAPDEADHYVRTLGVADGHLVGPAVPEARIGATRDQVAWTRQATRAVLVPAGMAPPNDCYVRDPHRSAGCLRQVPVPDRPEVHITAVGTYEPLPYLLPALVVHAGHDPRIALRWARAAGAVLALLLLAAAVACLGDPADPRSLLGLVAAVTPMVLFCAASLTGSGLEIAAGVAFVAALLRLARDASPPAWVWLAAGATGGVLAASRSASPLWVALELGLVAALLGRRAGWSRLRAGGRPAAAGGGLLAVGIIANRAWEAAYGPHVPLGTHALRLGLQNGLEQWWRASVDLVGKFGYLEYKLPLWLPLVWGAIVVALAVAAWRASTRRERVVLIAAAVGAATVPLALYVLVTRRTGFGLQGRQVLPFVIALPLLAGELAYRSARVPAWLLAAVPAAAGVVQVAAFYLNGRRSAVSIDGPLLFLGRAEWSPPIGWGFVLVLAAAGGVAIAAVGARRRKEVPLRASRPQI